MRSVLAVYVVIAIYLGIIRGAKCNNIPFTLNTETSRGTYSAFLSTLRAQLASGGTQSVNGIPILRQSPPQPSERFVLVDLTNYDDERITVAIDVLNVYIVGYRVGHFAYLLLQDDDSVPVDSLFRDTTTRERLPYTGSYTDLERAANQNRGEIYLGLSPLHDAIHNLWRDNRRSVPASLIVIVQMVSEAARYIAIENRIRTSIRNNDPFRPGSALLSLETNWSALSHEIQRADPENGMFSRTVVLRHSNNLQVHVNSIYAIQVGALALLLYRCGHTSTGGSNALVARPGIIRMPVNILVEDDDNDDDDDTCDLVLDHTTRISGRDGLCVDVRDGQDNNGNPIQLWSCGQQSNQQWRFQKDGTIRSLGKCMTAYGNSPADYVMLYDCNTSPTDATKAKWALSADGSFTNPHSGLVLTAREAAKGTTLTVETNNHGAGQGWRAGEDVDPLVSFIMGYDDLCMQANNDNSRVWMENCVLGGEQHQQWALYNDGTIRVNSDRSLCLTSDGRSSEDVINIRTCQGWGEQRWVFNTDGSILNPNSELVMDVRGNDVSLHQIILYKQWPNKASNQQWLPMF